MSATAQSEHIYILGVGNLGKLFAHALAASKSPPPITILTHRPNLPNDFAKSGSTISILRFGVTTSTAPNSIKIEHISTFPQTPISHLIVTTKAATTAPALLPLTPRLSPSSTILFTQNGMGVIDEVNAVCFPNPAERPNYLSAIVVHGVFTTGPFSATHAGVADMKVGHAHNGDEGRSGLSNADFPEESKYLVRKVVEAESLEAMEVQPKELVAVQLEKLIANACINPLTAIFRCYNGGLITPEVEPLRKALCHEASGVFLAYLESTTGLDDELRARFSPERLEEIALGMTTRTRENKSSMYQDVEAGRETEIDYINQWFVRKGEEAGLDADTHRRVVNAIKEKKVIDQADIADIFPKVRDLSTRGYR